MTPRPRASIIGPTDEVALPLEVRAVDEAQRLATMCFVRYGQTSYRLPKPERFMPGAFSTSVMAKRDRIPICDRHYSEDPDADKRPPAVARPVSWDVSDETELRCTCRFFDSADGWQTFLRVRDGDVDGSSVGFQALEERQGADGVREVTVAALHHVALLSKSEGWTPAYEAYRLVESRRAQDDWRSRSAALLAVDHSQAAAFAEHSPSDEAIRVGEAWLRRFDQPTRRP